MNRPGPGRPVQAVNNLNHNQNRTVSNGRMLASKPSTWAQAGLPPVTPSAQPNREVVAPDNWAQAMNPRTNAPLDLSASSFPSLNNSGLQSQSHNIPSSAWQTGPPQAEQTQRQQIPSSRSHISSRSQQQQQPSGVREGFYPTDTYSRNAPMEFGSEQQTQQLRRGSQAPSGPPGLPRQPNMQGDVSADPSRVASPSGQTQISRSPVSQNLASAMGHDRFLGQEARSLQKDFPADAVSSFETAARGEQSLESILGSMTEREKFGMKGYIAEQDNASPAGRTLMRGVDLATLGINMNSQEPLLPMYPGPWAEPGAQALRPLDTESTIPDCYTVKKIAPLSSRINGFMDETLFFIFYTMPRDYTQMLVAQELVARKWRYHMREKQWLTRDDASPSPVLLDDKVSEQGYYIWWDTKLWKKVRRIYTLRYEDLEEQPSMGNRAIHPGAIAGGVERGMGVGNINAVPSLERMAATGRGF